MSFFNISAIYFTLQIAGFLALLLVSWYFFDKRYKGKQRSSYPSPEQADDVLKHSHPTPEVFIDPADGKTYRVYYNEQTGTRSYVEEQSRS